MKSSNKWPEFREYARQKYPNELDEDIITMIEDLIERRKGKRLSPSGRLKSQPKELKAIERR